MADTENKTIGARILALAKDKHGWGAEDLAERLCVSAETVRKWAREGGTAPNRTRAVKVAELLGVSPEWVMYGREAVATDDGTADLLAAWSQLRGDGRLALLSFSKHLLHEPQTDVRSSISLEAARLIQPYDGMEPDLKGKARDLISQIMDDPAIVLERLRQGREALEQLEQAKQQRASRSRKQPS